MVYLLYLCPTGVTFFLLTESFSFSLNTNIPLVDHRSFGLPVLLFFCCDYKDIWDYDWNAAAVCACVCVCMHMYAWRQFVRVLFKKKNIQWVGQEEWIFYLQEHWPNIQIHEEADNPYTRQRSLEVLYFIHKKQETPVRWRCFDSTVWNGTLYS